MGMQASIKIANEPPQNVKANLRRAWSNFSQEKMDNAAKPKEWRVILFAVCWFHSVMQGRHKFGTQGWSRKYGFNTGDLTICSDVLNNYLRNNDVIPWDDLRYIFGEIMYGGHITDNWDRRVNTTYLLVLITPELFNNMNLAPGFKSPDASKFEYQHYVKYTEEKFPMETPNMFWLHPNAEF